MQLVGAWLLLTRGFEGNSALYVMKKFQNKSDLISADSDDRKRFQLGLTDSKGHAIWDE